MNWRIIGPTAILSIIILSIVWSIYLYNDYGNMKEEKFVKALNEQGFKVIKKQTVKGPIYEISPKNSSKDVKKEKQSGKTIGDSDKKERADRAPPMKRMAKKSTAEQEKPSKFCLQHDEYMVQGVDFKKQEEDLKKKHVEKVKKEKEQKKSPVVKANLGKLAKSFKYTTIGKTDKKKEKEESKEKPKKITNRKKNKGNRNRSHFHKSTVSRKNIRRKYHSSNRDGKIKRKMKGSLDVNCKSYCRDGPKALENVTFDNGKRNELKDNNGLLVKNSDLYGSKERITFDDNNDKKIANDSSNSLDRPDDFVSKDSEANENVKFIQGISGVKPGKDFNLNNKSYACWNNVPQKAAFDPKYYGKVKNVLIRLPKNEYGKRIKLTKDSNVIFCVLKQKE